MREFWEDWILCMHLDPLQHLFTFCLGGMTAAAGVLIFVFGLMLLA